MIDIRRAASRCRLRRLVWYDGVLDPAATTLLFSGEAMIVDVQPVEWVRKQLLKKKMSRLGD